MSEVVKIDNSFYTMDEVIHDLTESKDKIDDIIFVTFLKDGTAMVSHTGLPIQHLALACKLLDKEFDQTIDLEIEGQTNV